jgi:hypothetical protein
MWHQLGAASLATALVVVSSLAAAQPVEIRFDRANGGGLANSGAGTTVFHGPPSASATATVAAGGTTVFHGSPVGNAASAANGAPAATGSATAAAAPPPTGAGR